jgi:hypothetical protein
MFVAVQENQPDMVEALVNAGADIKFVDLTSQGFGLHRRRSKMYSGEPMGSVLHAAVPSAYWGRTIPSKDIIIKPSWELIPLLVELGADLEAENILGETVLSKAGGSFVCSNIREILMRMRFGRCIVTLIQLGADLHKAIASARQDRAANLLSSYLPSSDRS